MLPSLATSSATKVFLAAFIVTCAVPADTAEAPSSSSILLLKSSTKYSTSPSNPLLNET